MNRETDRISHRGHREHGEEPCRSISVASVTSVANVFRCHFGSMLDGGLVPREEFTAEDAETNRPRFLGALGG